MIFLCKAIMGSHGYGLNSETSDVDHRGVFINNDIRNLVGLGRHDHEQKQSSEEDSVYVELRHALNCLKKGNTNIIELLYNENWLEISDEWKFIVSHRKDLVDSERLFLCLRGYIQGEKRLALGQRKGKMGGKRYEQVIKYNFSPKNVVQVLRLAWCGQMYFLTGNFPVNVKQDPFLHGLLMDIKTHPEKYTKDQLNELIDKTENDLVEYYERRTIATKFNEKLADEICLEIYGKMIIDKYLDLTLKKTHYT